MPLRPPAKCTLWSMLNDPSEHVENKSLFTRTWGRSFKPKSSSSMKISRRDGIDESVKNRYDVMDNRRIRTLSSCNRIADDYYSAILTRVENGSLPDMGDLEFKSIQNVKDSLFDLLDRIEQVLNWRMTKPDIQNCLCSDSNEQKVADYQRSVHRTLEMSCQTSYKFEAVLESIGKLVEIFNLVRRRERLARLINYVISIQRVENISLVVQRILSVAHDYERAINLVNSNRTFDSHLVIGPSLNDRLHRLRKLCKDAIASAAASVIADLLNRCFDDCHTDDERIRPILRLNINYRGKDNTADLVMDLCVEYCNSLKRLSIGSVSGGVDNLSELESECRQTTNLSKTIRFILNILEDEQIAEKGSTNNTFMLCDQLIQGSLVSTLSSIESPNYEQIKLLLSVLSNKTRDNDKSLDIIGVCVRERVQKYLSGFHNRQLKCLIESLEKDDWTPSLEIPKWIQTLVASNPADEHSCFLIGNEDERETQPQSDNLIVDGKSYKISSSTVFFVILVHQYWELMSLNYDLPCDGGCFKFEAFRKMIELFKLFNSRVCQLLIGLGAIEVTGLDSIKITFLALAVRSLQFVLSTFLIKRSSDQLSPMVSAYEKVCSPCTCFKTDLLEQIINQVRIDYENHIKEILEKIIAIMELRFLEKEIMRYNPETSSSSNVVEKICAKIRSVDEALERFLDNHDRKLIVNGIKAKLDELFSRRLSQIDPIIAMNKTIADVKQIDEFVKNLAEKFSADDDQ